MARAATIISMMTKPNILLLLSILPRTSGVHILPVDWGFVASEQINATVGDTIRFSWTDSDLHDIFIHPSGDCNNTTGAIPVYPVPSAGGNASYTFQPRDGSPDGKDIFFVCHVGSGIHCSFNVNQAVKVYSRVDTPAPTNRSPSTPLPTIAPSKSPTMAPIEGPTIFPTTRPTISVPTGMPSVEASEQPTLSQTDLPTGIPTTTLPTHSPSTSPSVAASLSPTLAPSENPTTIPPTLDPSVFPTLQDTFLPSDAPSGALITPVPTASTLFPSDDPTIEPSSSPTLIPTVYPSFISSDPPSKVSHTPSVAPSMTTDMPSIRPPGATEVPSVSPSMIASLSPSIEIVFSTTLTPSSAPTGVLSSSPTELPILLSPSAIPSRTPTVEPTAATPSPSTGTQLEVVEGLEITLFGIGDLSNSAIARWESVTALYHTAFYADGSQGVEQLDTEVDVQRSERRRLQSSNESLTLVYTQSMSYRLTDLDLTPRDIASEPFATDDRRDLYVSVYLRNDDNSPALANVTNVSPVTGSETISPTAAPMDTDQSPAGANRDVQDDGDGLTTGAIIGIVVGILCACIICCLCVIADQRRQTNDLEEQGEEEANPYIPPIRIFHLPMPISVALETMLPVRIPSNRATLQTKNSSF